MSTRRLQFITAGEDGWTTLPEGEPAQPRAALLLDWARWLELRAQWPQELRAGVVFPNDADVKELLPDLPRLDVVALVFPKWTDGRAYSQARLLRVRHRYAGQLRAVGQVIPDMSAQLYRTGFDAVVLREGESAEVAQRMLDRFAAFYQGDAHEPRVRFARPAASGLGS